MLYKMATSTGTPLSDVEFLITVSNTGIASRSAGSLISTSILPNRSILSLIAHIKLKSHADYIGGIGM